jgi:hypothetical protein
MAGVLDVNKISGSDCDFDVTNDDVRYSYSIDKIPSILESTETDLEDLKVSDISASGIVSTTLSISSADIFETVDSDVVRLKNVRD